MGVAEVVAAVSVEWTAEAPVMLAAGAEQVSPVGEPLTEHEKLTWPVKPPDGVTVRVLVPLLPPVTVIAPPLESDRPGGEFTVTEPVPVPDE